MDLSNPQSFQSYGPYGLSPNIHYPYFFFLDPVAHHYFLTPSADAQFQGLSLQLGRKIYTGRNNLRFSTEIAVYLGNGTR